MKLLRDKLNLLDNDMEGVDEENNWIICSFYILYYLFYNEKEGKWNLKKNLN